jgi:hypothetical protein
MATLSCRFDPGRVLLLVEDGEAVGGMAEGRPKPSSNYLVTVIKT